MLLSTTYPYFSLFHVSLLFIPCICPSSLLPFHQSFWKYIHPSFASTIQTSFHSSFSFSFSPSSLLYSLLSIMPSVHSKWRSFLPSVLLFLYLVLQLPPAGWWLPVLYVQPTLLLWTLDLVLPLPLLYSLLNIYPDFNCSYHFHHYHSYPRHQSSLL